MEAFLFNLFAFILVISFIVFAHEFGHYYVAKLCGVKVEEFAIGMGKEIIGFNDKSGTRWKICWLPVGGYVKMFGDNDAASRPDSEIAKASAEEKKLMLHFKPLKQRFAVVSAGPIANFIFAFVLLFVFFTAYGKPYLSTEIGTILESSPAEKSGLEANDIILEINGNTISSFEEIMSFLDNIDYKAGDIFLFTVNRNGKEVSIPIEPDVIINKDVFGKEQKKLRIGIAPKGVNYKAVEFKDAISLSAYETYNISIKILQGLYEIITGKRNVKELGGPVRIAQFSGESLSHGVSTMIWFMALLSINLGVVNLLPIPLLDGGHLFLYIIEAIRGRPVSLKMQEYFFRIGLGFIVGLTIFVTFNDIRNLF